MTGSSLLTFPPEGFTFFPPHVFLLQFRSKGRTRKDCTTTWWPFTTPWLDRWPTTRKASPLNLAWPSGRSSTWCVNRPHLFTAWLCAVQAREFEAFYTQNHIHNLFSFCLNIPNHGWVSLLKGHFIWCTLWEPGWLQDGLDSPTQEFTKELKALLKDFGPSRDDATVQLLQIGQLHVCDATSSTASQRFSDWHCAPEASLRWFELCVVACS